MSAFLPLLGLALAVPHAARAHFAIEGHPVATLVIAVAPTVILLGALLYVGIRSWQERRSKG